MVLFTLDEFKEAEGVYGTRYDALLTRLAAAVSNMVDRYCRRTIEGTTFTEEIDGTGDPEIYVSNPPIRAVSSVKLTTLRDFASANSLGSTEYVFEPAGMIRILPTADLTSISALNAPIFWRGIRNIQVVYDGGYDTVPEDLKQAAILWTSALLVRRRQAGLLSSTIGPQTLTFQSRKVPLEVAAILDSYKLSPSFIGRSVS